MADTATAVDIVLGIIETQGGTSNAKTLVPALVDLGDIISGSGGGGGTIEDGSVTTAKLDDGAVTTAKVADDAITIAKIADDALLDLTVVDLVAADATAQTALDSIGIEAVVMSPADLSDLTDTAGGWAHISFRLCWFNSDNKLEIAPLVIESAPTSGFMAYAIGKDSTASGKLDVDSSWTVTANSSGGGGSQTSWYGTCSTAVGTAAKDVTCSGFELVAGARIAIKFTKANSQAAPTLNVNGTGAKSIYIANTLSADNVLKWVNPVILTFVYDGTNWFLEDKPSILYAVCSSTASTANKVVTLDSYSRGAIQTGTLLVVKASNANSVSAGKIQLNVSSTGDSSVYRGGSETSASNTLFWDANTTLTFIRNGAHWDFVCADKELPTTAPA